MSPANSNLEQTVDQSTAERQRAQVLSRQMRPPAQVEGYEIDRCLGAGAFGTVWLAVQKSTGKQVAIKFYEHRGGLDWALLNREVEKLAVLYTDRDIVQLIDVGWNATPPYYVMEYLERGSVEQLLARGSLPASEAVRIVREVAQALVHAHGRGILHCDLKPANVLLDNDWKVRLADFGQSRLSYEQQPALGTLFYMAPEQADLQAAPDARWDVYALGALLYHLLTGRPPYRTTELEARLTGTPDLTKRLEVYRQSIHAAPRPTDHRGKRGVDRSLAEVVDRCLDPDPARRFPNAQAVLDAIDRRARHRARRPLLWLGFVAPLLLLVGTVAQGVIGWRDAVRSSEASLVRAVQAGNAYAAQGVASTVLLQLRRLSNAVERTAEDDDLRQSLAENDPQGVKAAIERAMAFYNSDPRTRGNSNGGEPPFESWIVMNPNGTLLARAPHNEAVIGVNYAWRDYFQGAMRLAESNAAEGVYISRVIQSEADKLYKCAISALIRADGQRDAPIIGVVVATITTGSLPLHDEQRTAVLVGRWDKNRRPNDPTRAAQPDDLILLHPAYHRGDPAADIQNSVLRNIRQASAEGRELAPEETMDDFYADPLSARSDKYAGRWLAGFAPVGNTEFVVIVQQPYVEAIRPLNSLARTLAWRGWTALCFGVILLGTMWYYVQRAMHWDDGSTAVVRN
jgi:hypothetical protein